MSLWPLTPMRKVQMNRPSGQTVPPSYGFIHFHLWVPGRGLLCAAETYEPGYMTLDGVFEVLMGSQATGALGWWHARQRIVKWDSDKQIEYQFEPRALLRQWSGPAEDLPPDPAGGNFPYQGLVGNPYFKLRDRRVYFESSRMHGVDRNGVTTIEGPSFPFGTGRAMPGRSEGELFVVNNHNYNEPALGIFYNTEAREFSSPLLIIKPLGTFSPRMVDMVYCVDFGVIAALILKDEEVGSSYWIQIYSLEIKPEEMTTIAIAKGEVKSGQVVTYQVRVLGDMADPVEGELVDWFLDGAGSLIDVQSKVDAQGYAKARVQYLVGETGASTVTARLIC